MQVECIRVHYSLTYKSPLGRRGSFSFTFFLLLFARDGSDYERGEKNLNQWPQWYFFAPAASVPGCVYRFIDYHHKAVICQDLQGHD